MHKLPVIIHIIGMLVLNRLKIVNSKPVNVYHFYLLILVHCYQVPLLHQSYVPKWVMHVHIIKQHMDVNLYLMIINYVQQLESVKKDV